MFYLITIIVTFTIILFIGEVLKSKPKWLVNLVVDIWKTPYANKKQIDKVTIWLVVIAYLVILTISIIKKY